MSDAALKLMAAEKVKIGRVRTWYSCIHVSEHYTHSKQHVICIQIKMQSACSMSGGLLSFTMKGYEGDIYFEAPATDVELDATARKELFEFWGKSQNLP